MFRIRPQRLHSLLGPTRHGVWVDAPDRLRRH